MIEHRLMETDASVAAETPEGVHVLWRVSSYSAADPCELSVIADHNDRGQRVQPLWFVSNGQRKLVHTSVGSFKSLSTGEVDELLNSSKLGHEERLMMRSVIVHCLAKLIELFGP